MSYKRFIADATIVNGQDEWNDTKFLVGLWPGSGYGMDLFVVCAPDVNDALDILSHWLAKNKITTYFYDTKGMTDDEIQEAEDYGQIFWADGRYLIGENLSIEQL